MNEKKTAEQVALRDISEYVQSQAKDITHLYNTFGYQLGPYGFWDNTVTIVISRMFVSAKFLYTKENRKLNKKLIK
jgi:hypothetical protein